MADASDRTEAKEPAEPRPSRLRRVLMKVFGPADLGEEHQHNPLTGTKYDPARRKP